MYAIQAENCCPVVETWNHNQTNCLNYKGKPSIANGLAVPQPFAEQLMLDVLKESGGLPIAVSDQDMLASMKEIAKTEGMIIAPEGAALFSALITLTKQKQIQPSEKILILNTGSGYKYLENL